MSSGSKRQRSVNRKLSPQATEIKDKVVLLVDDSIVRGTTSREIIRMVKSCGAKKVYFVSTCSPLKYPCFYGIDIPSEKELLASKKTVAEIEQYLGVDHLMYQHPEDIIEAITRKSNYQIDKPCMACLDGDYVCGVSQANQARARID